MKPSIDLIGTRVLRGDSSLEGTVTRRIADNYLVRWDSGQDELFCASRLEADIASQAYAEFSRKRPLTDRAREARASLEAIRSGNTVPGSAAELTADDRAKILARLTANEQKFSPPISPPKREAPATAPARDDNAASAAEVSKHLRALLKAKAKN